MLWVNLDMLHDDRMQAILDDATRTDMSEQEIEGGY